MKRFCVRLAALLVAGVGSGCNGLTGGEAVSLVREFDARLAEAYRTGDATRVEGIAGDEQAKRITGLIGVKLDQGINLDGRMTAFDVREVTRGRDRMIVVAEERWEYRDRRIGTGEQVGDASVDAYVMRYVLQRHGERWLVDEVGFAEPPRVGRTRVMSSGSAALLHSIVTNAPNGDPQQRGSAPGAPAAPRRQPMKGEP